MLSSYIAHVCIIIFKIKIAKSDYFNLDGVLMTTKKTSKSSFLHTISNLTFESKRRTYIKAHCVALVIMYLLLQSYKILKKLSLILHNYLDFYIASCKYVIKKSP